MNGRVPVDVLSSRLITTNQEMRPGHVGTTGTISRSDGLVLDEVHKLTKSAAHAHAAAAAIVKYLAMRLGNNDILTLPPRDECEI